jgi:hypothetical protein
MQFEKHGRLHFLHFDPIKNIFSGKKVKPARPFEGVYGSKNKKG